MASYSKTRLLSEDELLRNDLQLESMLAPPPAAQVASPSKLREEELPEPHRAAPPARQTDNSEMEAMLAAIDQARGRAKETRFVAQIGGIGQNLVENVTGAKGGAFFSDMEKNADQPVEDMKADITAKQLVESGRRAKEKGDPNSPYSRAAQEALSSSNPTLARSLKDQLYGLTEDQIGKLSEGRMKFDDQQIKRDTLTSMDAWRDGKLAHDVSQDDYKGVVDRYKAVTGRIGALKAKDSVTTDPVGGGAKNSGINERLTISRLDKLGTETHKYAEYAKALEEIDQIVPGFIRGQVPKDYPLTTAQKVLLADPTGLAGRAADPRAVALNRAIREFIDLLGRARSGAVLNEGEEKHYQRLLENSTAAGPQQAAIAFNQARQALGQALKTRQLSFGAPAPGEPRAPLEIWENELGGLSYKSPLFYSENDARPLSAAPSPIAPGFPNARPAPPRTAAPPLPTSTEVKEPTGQVRVRHRASGRVKLLPAEAAGALASNPAYEVL